MDDQSLQMPNSLTEMMDSLGINDPRLRLFAEMMERQSSATATQPSLEEKLAKKRRALARLEALSRENHELIEENQLLRERLDLLAAALGACPDCWGEDPSCAVCRGKGVPGSAEPDRDAFATYVLPVVRAIKRSRAGSRQSDASGSRDKAATGVKTGDKPPLNENHDDRQ